MDEAIFRFINGTLSNQVFDILMPHITTMGGFFVGICILLSHLPNDLRFTKIALPLYCLNSAVVEGAKLVFATKRPYLIYFKDLETESLGRLPKMLEANSFPSGHAAVGMSLAILFSIKYPRFAWAFLALGFSVGFSRVYLGAHHPVDVFGSWIISAIIVGLGYRLADRFLNAHEFSFFSNKEENL